MDSFDAGILSSTALNDETQSEQSPKSLSHRIESEDSISVLTVNSTKDPATNVPTQRKKQSTVPKPKVPRKRRLRPEDQRALNILSEKFRSAGDGMLYQIENCAKKMKSAKPSNLKRHLSNVHPKEYANLFPNEVNRKKQAEVEAFNAVQDAIELVTIHGYPFYMFEAPAMRGFINARLHAVQPEGYSFSINRHGVVTQVADGSDAVKQRIKEELKGRMICITFDVCTISTLSVIGVDAMFMDGQNVESRSLGVIKITERHTSVQLANSLYDIFAEFDINLANIFSITTDTAKNATGTTNVLDLVVSSNTEEDIAEDSMFDAADDDIDFGIDLENEIELQKITDNMALHTRLVEQMTEGIVAKNSSLVWINQINCGTHVIQLITNDALKESDSIDTIHQTHEMAVMMRNQVVMIEIRKLKCDVIIPPLDNATRWNSKYVLVN